MIIIVVDIGDTANPCNRRLAERASPRLIRLRKAIHIMKYSSCKRLNRYILKTDRRIGLVDGFPWLRLPDSAAAKSRDLLGTYLVPFPRAFNFHHLKPNSFTKYKFSATKRNRFWNISYESLKTPDLVTAMQASEIVPSDDEPPPAYQAHQPNQDSIMSVMRNEMNRRSAIRNFCVEAGNLPRESDERWQSAENRDLSATIAYFRWLKEKFTKLAQDLKDLEAIYEDRVGEASGVYLAFSKLSDEELFQAYASSTRDPSQQIRREEACRHSESEGRECSSHV